MAPISSSEPTLLLEYAKNEKEKKVVVEHSPSASPSTSPSTAMMNSAILSLSVMSTSLSSVGSKSDETGTDISNVSIDSVESTDSNDVSRESNVDSPDKTTEDFNVDIDTALEEVMAGLKSLEMQQKQDKRMSLPAVKVKQTPKHTPDLVLDLPDGNITSSCTDSLDPDSPTISAAENFAKSNQGTLKKASTPHIKNQELANRLSISSEPGDLARQRELHEGGVSVGSQAPLYTFSLKRTHSALPSRGHSVDSRSRSEPSSSSPISTSTPITSQAPPSFTPPSSFSETAQTQPTIPPANPGPPPVAQKPKLPMKVKPPVMKKPTSRPDISSSPPLQPPQ